MQTKMQINDILYGETQDLVNTIRKPNGEYR